MSDEPTPSLSEVSARPCAIVVMALVTTLNSLRSQEIRREGGPSRARAPVPRKARHARYPAGLAQDGPRRSAGPGLGLADADSDERPDRAPARAREARVRPRRP